jgi:hypothetical protein
MPSAASNNGLVMNVGVSRRRAGRSVTLVRAKPTLADRAVNPHLPPPCGFVDGAKRRRPQFHRLNKKHVRCCFCSTHSKAKRNTFVHLQHATPLSWLATQPNVSGRFEGVFKKLTYD